MKLSELDILDFGLKLGLVGAVFGDEHRTLLAMFPNQGAGGIDVLELDDEDWKKVLRQTDILEVEVLEMADDKTLSKAIYRKTQRLIEQRVSWAVFHRDGYQCRYCAAKGIPMTVDHLVLWEEGGPSIPENLVTACRKCNKTRGNTQYAEWLESPYYKKKAKNLFPRTRDENLLLVGKLDAIPRNHHQRSRGKKK